MGATGGINWVHTFHAAAAVEANARALESYCGGRLHWTMVRLLDGFRHQDSVRWYLGTADEILVVLRGNVCAGHHFSEPTVDSISK